jgi:hypothetical protein
MNTKMEISSKTHETDRWLKSSYVKGAVAGLGSMIFVYIIDAGNISITQLMAVGLASFLATCFLIGLKHA